MSPTKLTYFNVSGLGEGIRYLLHYGGVDFEDERITKEEFPGWKDKLPLGQLPVLDFEGRTLYQSMSICRFLAKRFHLTGQDEWDTLKCDIAIDTIADIASAITPSADETDEEAKKAKKAAALTKINFLTEKLEEQLANNDGHFVDGQLTWSDLMFAALYPTLLHRAGGEDIFAERPLLKALKAKVDALPAIKAYLDKRPPVPY
ncbi:Hypothetical predicted protein [Cloeon dipterum]|uniref:glutathione transferase n=1 Tax=Cloeon dipterum TaxID=197152 RepID=A0A8S1CLR7_9INSE|nr:Hypothetical predicted protein [Cloeon dipterum]